MIKADNALSEKIRFYPILVRLNPWQMPFQDESAVSHPLFALELIGLAVRIMMQGFWWRQGQRASFTHQLYILIVCNASVSCWH